MRVVRTCDFCGDDATGLYEPLPSSIPDGPRLLLCDGCRERLASVVDPLVDRLDGDAAASVGEPADSRAETPERTRRPTSEPQHETSEVPDRPASEQRTADDRPSDEADDATVSPPPERNPENTVSESRDASGRAQADRAGTPHGYRKVMRFLENRELPVEREQAIRLAAEAYELDDADVDQCIDHAVQYGRLREVRGELKR